MLEEEVIKSWAFGHHENKDGDEVFRYSDLRTSTIYDDVPTDVLAEVKVEVTQTLNKK